MENKKFLGCCGQKTNIILLEYDKQKECFVKACKWGGKPKTQPAPKKGGI